MRNPTRIFECFLRPALDTSGFLPVSAKSVKEINFANSKMEERPKHERQGLHVLRSLAAGSSVSSKFDFALILQHSRWRRHDFTRNIYGHRAVNGETSQFSSACSHHRSRSSGTSHAAFASWWQRLFKLQVECWTSESSLQPRYSFSSSHCQDISHLDHFRLEPVTAELELTDVKPELSLSVTKSRSTFTMVRQKNRKATAHHAVCTGYRWLNGNIRVLMAGHRAVS